MNAFSFFISLAKNLGELHQVRSVVNTFLPVPVLPPLGGNPLLLYQAFVPFFRKNVKKSINRANITFNFDALFRQCG